MTSFDVIVAALARSKASKKYEVRSKKLKTVLRSTDLGSTSVVAVGN